MNAPLPDDQEIYVLGYFDTDGNYSPYRSPIRANEFNRHIIDRDGMVWAVADAYGDWVNPNLVRLGIKSRIKVVEVPAHVQ